VTLLSKTDQLIRSASPDRPLLSANDWWGLGFLRGIGACCPAQEVVHRWYCSERGAREQYVLGVDAGREHAA
jgi:hypothetical protein